MSVIPRSSAAQMLWIERSSSVPPHIQPPIAQVPSPMREGERLVPGIFTYSMNRLLCSPVTVPLVLLDLLQDRASHAAGGCEGRPLPVHRSEEGLSGGIDEGHAVELDAD